MSEIEKTTEDNCVFCKIANGEIPSEKIYENDSFFSIFDINPLVEGHSLLISRNHFETISDLPNNLGSDFLDCVKGTIPKIIEKFNPEGFNLHNNNKEIAGQLVHHFHMHIIPRKKDDGFKPCA